MARLSIPAYLAAALLTAEVVAQAPRDLRVERVPQARSVMPDKRMRWAVVVGISTYRNVPPHFQLQYAHRDAEEFAGFLRSREGGGLSAANVRLLTESDATLATIRSTIENWLPRVAGPDDVVYVFFAGHGVLGPDNRGYFVAHDSDPQNLAATALPFDEVDTVLSSRLKAGITIVLADACHAGSIGWTANQTTRSTAQTALERIGSADRAVLKLLASRPSEQSFEDARWEGGHGVFTYALLHGLRGAAERDDDGVVRVSELIDFVARYVPAETASRQNPRVAGNFEGRLPLSTLTKSSVAAGPRTRLRVVGKPGVALYVNDTFRGNIRNSRELWIDNVETGDVRLSVDIPGEGSFEEVLRAAPPETAVHLDQLPGLTLLRIQRLAGRGHVLGRGGALELFASQSLPPLERAAAEAAVAAGLEEIGQACVSDYVQSTASGLKRSMLNQAVQAYAQLLRLRPGDRGVEMRKLFCTGRAEIAAGRFEDAVRSLKAALQIDPAFACTHNALGVAYLRLGRERDALQSFHDAARFAPEWGLPSLQNGQVLLARGDARASVEHFEKAVKLSPHSMSARWHLLRAYRLSRRNKDFEQQLVEALAADPNYPPIYLESGLYYRAASNYEKALEAMNTYLLLAPNYADSTQVKESADELRKQLARFR